MNESRANLAQVFRRFGEHECTPSSPLYARLSLGIAEDTDLLDLAASAHARPVPNLLFGAVHHLLLCGIVHPLAAFYPSLTDAPLDLTLHDPVPLFRAFCLEHAEVIRIQLATRRVQTNEIRRCACLLPAFVRLAEDGKPLALVEIGTSAGLNLLWDRYQYDYGQQQWGDSSSPVRLRCTLRNDRTLSLPVYPPEIVYRMGLDLNPIDVTDDDATAWLRALIWPEHRERAQYLQQAIELARRSPPPMRHGDAVALLPDVLAEIPPDTTLILYHSFVLNQFPTEARERFYRLLHDFAQTRDFALLSIEGALPPPVKLATYRDGERTERTLATCDPHGAWLDWQGV